MAIALCMPSPRAHAGDDRLESFLRERGLSELLVEHGLRRLRTADAASRAILARELANDIAAALEAAPPDADRTPWAARSESLMAIAPEADTPRLRLALARAEFAPTEAVIDRWRVRAAPEPEARAAIDRLPAIAERFAAIARLANQQVDSLERQEQALRADDGGFLADALALQRRLRSEAHYSAGWARAAQSEFTPASREALAREAMLHFAWLLGGPPGSLPALDQVPPSLLRYEHVTRSMVGVALCHALRGDSKEAMDWLDALDRSDETPESVRSQIHFRRLQALAAVQRWEAVLDRVGRAAAGSEALSADEAALLIAASASATGDAAVTAAVLRERAYADLFRGGHFGRILSLTDQLGWDALQPPLSTLLIDAITGLRALERTREKPAARPGGPPAWEAAAKAFARAATEARRLELTDLLPVILRLQGAANIESADRASLLSAAEAFDQAAALAEDPAGTQAGDDAWSSLAALERAAAMPPPDPALADRHAAALGAFARRFPTHSKTSLAALALAVRADTPDEDTIARLLAIPDTSEAYWPARRQAVRLLHVQLRQAAPAEQGWLSARFIAVAEALAAHEALLAQSGDTSAADRFDAYARRLIEAHLLTPELDRPGAARTLESLTAAFARSAMSAETRGVAEVLQVRLDLAEGGFDDSLARLRAASSEDPARTLLAWSMLYAHAAEAWRHAPPDRDSPERHRAAERMVEAGRGLLSILDADPKFEADPAAVLQTRAGVAEAAAALWFARRQTDMRDLAAVLYRIALRARPNDERLLLGWAALAESTADWPAAADAWRLIVSAREAGSPAWFEARASLIGVLRHADVNRARESLRQLVALYPNLGPETSRARLVELAAALGVNVPKEAGP